jgi:hypothetical protein
MRNGLSLKRRGKFMGLILKIPQQIPKILKFTSGLNGVK